MNEPEHDVSEPTQPSEAATDASAPPPVAPAAPTGWVSPGPESGGTGRTSGCLIAAVVGAFAMAALAVIAIFALIFLGGQVQSLLKGTVEFGTGGTGCSVTGRATTFPASTTIHVAAYLEREASAGESITLAATGPDGTTETRDQTMTESATCLAFDLPSGLPAGHYVIELRSGSETLSKGAFDITP